MNNVNFKKMVKCQGQKVKYQQKYFFTGNTHVKYQSSSTPYSNIISNVKVFKKYVKLQGQGHKVKTFGTHGEVLSHRILM